MAKLITVYWRDIPAQVIAKQGRGKAKVQLPPRFQKAITSAAMRADKGSSQAYLDEWRREQTSCSDDLQAQAQATTKQLEQQYDNNRLQALIYNKGKEE